MRLRIIVHPKRRYVASMQEAMVRYTLRSPRTSGVLGIDPERLTQPSTNWSTCRLTKCCTPTYIYFRGVCPCASFAPIKHRVT